MERQIISIEVEDKPGVMARISALFNRRGFNIESLTVGNIHRPGRSVFTVTVTGDEAILEQIRKQCQKLIHVITVTKLEPKTSVIREFALVKVACNDNNRQHVNELINRFNVRLLHVEDSALVLGMSDTSEMIEEFIHLMGTQAILEFIRSGKMALGFK